jgi:hypothetical protein
MIRPKITVHCDDYLWEQFKKTVPRDITLMDFIVFMIAKRVDDAEHDRILMPYQLEFIEKYSDTLK